MKKITLPIINVAALLFLLSTSPLVRSIGLTTGFTFDLSEPYPLEHVYVGAGGPGGGGTYEDILLPGGVLGPGFTVPTGISSFALEQTMSNDLMDVYAVIGTYVDGTGETHVVLGTGEDLTGVYWGDVLSSPFGLTWTSLIDTLVTGTGIIYLIENLHTSGHMAPFGSTIQLYFFSDFAQPMEAFALSSDFGDPEPPIIMNDQPVAIFTETASIIPAGTSITFDPGDSYDPDGTIVLYEFDFDGDGTFDYSSATSNEVTHTYVTPGVFTVHLRVTDDAGSTDTATAEKTIIPGQVIPEIPWGTIMASAAMIFAFVGYFAVPRFRKKI